MNNTRDYKARFAEQKDLPQIVEWIHENRGKNHYDPELFQYDSTRVVAVDRDGCPVCYLPMQFTLMTESLAPRPGRTRPETARALKEAIHFVVRLAKQHRIGETYFLCDPEDKETAAFAKTHGYEELPFRVMRLKPRNMYPPLPEDKE